MARMTVSILAQAGGFMLSAFVAGGALAHEGDAGHWFEHQLAMTDGGSTLIAPAPSARKNGEDGSVVDTGLAANPRGRMRASPGDCLIEQLQMTDGYVPTGRCTGGYADERWVVDEDKQRAGDGRMR